MLCRVLTISQANSMIYARMKSKIEDEQYIQILNATSTHMRLPPEFKHINKGRKRN